MDSIPEAGSTRSALALGTWAAITLLFLGLLVYSMFFRRDGDTPWLAVVGGAGSLIGIWRWILEQRKAAQPAEKR